MADITRQQVIDYLSNLSVMDIAQLTKDLEDKWGVKAAAPVAVAAAMPGGGAAESKEEEQTEFTVELTATGEKKIQVIKVIREITQMGLKEAKDFVESAPKNVREAISKEEANEIKKKLEEAGATITIK
jgi:large subunit ribosomal protein L7/L12